MLHLPSPGTSPSQPWEKLPDCYYLEPRHGLKKADHAYPALIKLDYQSGRHPMLVYLKVEAGSDPILSRVRVLAALPLEDNQGRRYIRLSPEAEAMVFKELSLGRVIAVQNARNPSQELRAYDTVARLAPIAC